MTNVRAIIQVRLDSSRLPGKALLWTPSGPLFVLSALRASEDGVPTIVATSDDEDGRTLRSIAAQWGVDAVLGSKDDVLGRFVLASQDLPDDAILVRLTADNILPDGLLVQACVSRFEDLGCDYLTTKSESTPYGLAIEVFRRSSLLEAARNGDSEFDHEHVTPWMLRQESYVQHSYVPTELDETAEYPSVTIDTLEDYRRWLPVFLSHHDLVGPRWNSLLSSFLEVGNAL